MIDQLITAIVDRNKMQKKPLEQALASLTADDKRLLEQYIDYCQSVGVEVSYLADAYDLIVKDTIKEMMYFNKHGKYRCSSYQDVAETVLYNDEYMGKYMYGLALTTFFWPNHIGMRVFYEEHIPRDKKGRYLEIGPGHGFNMMQALKLSAFDSFKAVDISPTSVALTDSILSSKFFGDFSDFEIIEANFLEFDIDDKYDAIVAGEVLEHVENPEAFLEKIRELAKPGAFIYISTCMNAPMIDHIALFESEQHLQSIIESSGLKIKDKVALPYPGSSLKESAEKKLPINTSLVLEVAS